MKNFHMVPVIAMLLFTTGVLAQESTPIPVGTSRNLDRRILRGEVSDIKQIEGEYRSVLDRGADVIETDIPTLLGKLLTGPLPPSSTSVFFHPK